MFLGVSTGRAGSKWIADVFNRLGFPCTHEQYFRAGRTDWPAVKGEWSAQAVPYLADYQVPVFHQVRHPLDVIGSYLNRGWFDGSELGSENRFMVEHANIDRTANPLAELARFYVEWNQRIEPHAVLRWQVETFSEHTAWAVSEIVGMPLRRPFYPMPALNTSEHSPVGWDDIPEPSRTSLRQAAASYGYE